MELNREGLILIGADIHLNSWHSLEWLTFIKVGIHLAWINNHSNYNWRVDIHQGTGLTFIWTVDTQPGSDLFDDMTFIGTEVYWGWYSEFHQEWESGNVLYILVKIFKLFYFSSQKTCLQNTKHISTYFSIIYCISTPKIMILHIKLTKLYHFKECGWSPVLLPWETVQWQGK